MLDRARKVAINSYVFTNLLIAIERTLATIMLQSYEDFKHPCILVLSILIPWIVGLGMLLLVVIGNFSQILWIIIMGFMVCLTESVSLFTVKIMIIRAQTPSQFGGGEVAC